MTGDDSTAVDPREAHDPLVLALDVGTSSVRALVYDASGRAIRSLVVHRPYAVTTTPDGGVVVDPGPLFELTCQCVDSILEVVRKTGRSLAAVACDTFWHSLVGLRGREPATPVYTWADTRSSDAAEELRHRLDETVLRTRTGTQLHSSYWPAKLLWLSRTGPATFRSVTNWISFAEYLFLRLFGELRVSISMASGTGLFNQLECDWDEVIIRDLPLRRDQLSPVFDFSDAMAGLNHPWASRWRELAYIPWYLGIGDGAANNVGSGGSGDDRAVLMVGTSGALRVVREARQVDTPTGIWTYRVDRRRYVQGGALSAGGNVYAWAVSTLAVGHEATLRREIGAIAPDSHGLTVLPFLAGERSPDWNVDARSAIVGITLDTQPSDIVRALLEATSYRFGLLYQILERQIPSVKGVIGSGAALVHSTDWTQLMADVLGVPVTMSAVPEATSRGGALLALESLGAIPHVSAVPAPMGTTFAPTEPNVEIYRAAMIRQQDLYHRLLG